MGRIRAAVAKRLAAFDADIAYFARSRRDTLFAFEPDLVELAR